MKKSLFTLVFAIGLAMGFIPLATRATTLENIEFFVDADSAKGLDGKVIIDFSKSGSNYNGTLYLPGSAAVDNLKLSWNGTGVTVKIGGSTYVSGNAPIPAVGATTTYTVTADNGTASYSLKTMKGSGTVKAMFFNIDESKGTVSAMNSDRNHDTKCYGSLTFDGQTNYMTIKGRGNSTWREFDKKPYNITIFKKDDYAEKKKVNYINGVEAKSWSILANAKDPTCLRNKIGYDIAKELGIGLDSENIDIWMNGKFLGNYLLTPKNDYKSPKNGYMVEIDNGSDSDQFNLTNSPTFTVKDMADGLTVNDVKNSVSPAWNAIRNSSSDAYLDYVDIDSFAKMYLLQELYKDVDACAGSKFFTKETMDADTKLVAGPIWDLDGTLGRVSTSYVNITDRTAEKSGSGWYNDIISNNSAFFQLLGKHESFMRRVYEVYNENKDKFNGSNGILNDLQTQRSKIADSAEMNFVRWSKYMTNTEHFTISQNGQKYGNDSYAVTYKKTDNWSNFVDNLKEYITKRLSFLSDKLTVTAPVAGDITGTTSVYEDESLSLTANCTANSYKWQSSDNGTDWTDIAGATKKTYSLTAKTSMNGLYIRYIATNKGTTINTTRVAKAAASASAISTPVQLTVNTVPAHEHLWGEPEYTWLDNYTKCKVTRTCSVAGCKVGTETKTVNSTSEVTKAATCTLDGERTYTADFGDPAFTVQTKVVPIPATGHSYGTVTYTWEKDYSKCTASRVCANNPSHTETETVDSTSKVTKDPTCTRTGTRTYTASFQNKAFTSQTKTETIEATGHNYGNATYSWSNDKSRCTASRVCANNASHTETETVNATSQVTKDATCTAEGEKTQTATFRNTAFKTQTTTAVIPAKGHNYGAVTYTWEDDLSKCTASRVCANDATHKETETVNTSSRVTREATCTVAGERTYTASFVNKAFTGQTKTETIAAKGHNYGKATYSWNNDKSRCTASRVCANDASHTETETVNAASQVTKDATCTAEGEKTLTATFRNTAFETQTTTAAIPAKGHNYGAVTYTWENDSSKCTASRVCANDATHKETETVNTSSRVTREATCTVAGERTYTASFENKAFTGQTKTEVIAAKGHNYGKVTYSWNDDKSRCTASRVCANDASHTETETVNATSRITTDATCTAEGERTYTASFRNTAFETQTTTAAIPAKGHNYGAVTYTWEDDLSKCTASRVCANDATHKETETVETSSKVTKEATCTVAGERTYTASFENKAFTSQTKTEPITTKGHNYGAVTYTWADDLTKCTASRVCANDETHKETETVETSSKVTKDATCTLEGERTYTASFENKAFTSQTKTEPIAAKGHSYGIVTYTWAPDFSKCTASRVCANDPKHIETETVPASTQITKPATTTEMGETTYTAVFTNKAFLEQKQTVTDIPVLQKEDPETSPEGSSDGTNNGSSSNNGSSVNDETNNNSELSKEIEPTSSLPEKMDLPSVKISSLRAGKKYMTVRWKKIKKENRRKIGKIEIQIAQDSKFTKIIKKKSVNKNKTFKKITGLKLKSKTRYWVRIRAYKKTEDIKHVSAWKVKKIRVK